MDLRRWEDLNTDCLVQVLKKVDTYTLVVGVQFVCKSWFKATLHKECWEILDVQYAPASRAGDYSDNCTRLYNTRLIKLAVSRSHGTVTKAVLPRLFKKDALRCIADECPGLKCLELPTLGKKHYSFNNEETWVLPILCKLKSLEVLELGFDFDTSDFGDLLSAVGNNLVSLTLSSPSSSDDNDVYYKYSAIGNSIGEIAELVPKIQYLTIRGMLLLGREGVLKILTGCRELVVFDIRGCNGFGCVESDEEIMRKASHIKNFLFSPEGFYDSDQGL